MLRFGLTGATFTGPATGASTGTVRVGEAGYGPALGGTPFVAEVMPVTEQTAGAGQGCETFYANNAKAVKGKFALINRGICSFVIKVKNAQNAGAVGVLIADNAVEVAAVPSGLGGSDPTITIPSVRIFNSDGLKLQDSLKSRSRTSSGVFVSLGIVIAQYAGADPLGRAQLFAPNPYQSGSSVSHYDTPMTRNQLMEPAINGDLTQTVIPPIDMTFLLLQDIGWSADIDAETGATVFACGVSRIGRFTVMKRQTPCPARSTTRSGMNTSSTPRTTARRCSTSTATSCTK